MNQPPFQDRQTVSLSRWDKSSPPWDRMGDCIVVGQRQAKCESGWMITVMSKDGTYKEIDSHWIKHHEQQSNQPNPRR